MERSAPATGRPAARTSGSPSGAAQVLRTLQPRLIDLSSRRRQSGRRCRTITWNHAHKPHETPAWRGCGGRRGVSILGATALAGAFAAVVAHSNPGHKSRPAATPAKRTVRRASIRHQPVVTQTQTEASARRRLRPRRLPRHRSRPAPRRWRPPAQRDRRAGVGLVSGARHDGAPVRRRRRGLARAHEELERELAEIDRACSRFRDDSELARLNALGGNGAVAGRPASVRSVEVALVAAESTGGLVDPTVGRTLRLAGYDRRFARSLRDGASFRARFAPRSRLARGSSSTEARDDRARARRRARPRRDREGARRRPQRRRGRCGLGHGVLVSLGGDVAVGGTAAGGGWPVRIADDHAAALDEPGPTVAIESGGLATSGTTVRRWQAGGVELHHIIDPRTGRPAATPWRTVTVAARSCVDANVASTAAIVSARRRRLARRARLPARLVRQSGEVELVGVVAGGRGVTLAAARPERLLVPDARRRASSPSCCSRRACCSASSLDSVGGPAVAALRRRRPAPERDAARARLRRRPRRDDDPRRLHADRRSATPSFRSHRATGRSGSASARSRSTCCSRSIATSLLRARIGLRTWRRPLARVRVVAGRARPRARHGQRRPRRLVRPARPRLGRDRRAGRALAVVEAREGSAAVRLAGGLAALAIPAAIAVWATRAARPAGRAAPARRPRLLAAPVSTTTSAVRAQQRRCRQRRSRRYYRDGSRPPRRPRTASSRSASTRRAAGGSKGMLHVALRGVPLENGGVQMTASSVTYGPRGAPGAYSGDIVSLAGQRLVASVQDAQGHALDLTLTLHLDSSSRHAQRVAAASHERRRRRQPHSTATGLPRLLAGPPPGPAAALARRARVHHGPLPSARGLIELVRRAACAAAAAAASRRAASWRGRRQHGAGRSSSPTARRASRSAQGQAAAAPCAAPRARRRRARGRCARRARSRSSRSNATAGEELGIVCARARRAARPGLELAASRSFRTGFVDRRGDGARQRARGRTAKPTVHPAAAVRARRPRRADTRPERRDARPHRADRALRADWFRALGTATSPARRLFTVSGAVGRPGVYEVALGTPLRALVAQAGGVAASRGAFLVGGYFGSWVEPVTAQGSRCSTSELAPRGCQRSAPARSSCCRRPPAALDRDGPRRPLPRRRERRASAARASTGSPRSPARSRRSPPVAATAVRTRCAGCEQVHGRGACRHPDGAARFVESSLEVFADEVELHLHGRCSGRRGEFLPTVGATR